MSTKNNYFTNKSKEELRSLYLEYEDFQRTGVFQNGSKLSDAADFYQNKGRIPLPLRQRDESL